ncbi:hypothetical protein ACJX0J_036225, partial [Zea mays]
MDMVAKKKREDTTFTCTGRWTNNDDDGREGSSSTAAAAAAASAPEKAVVWTHAFTNNLLLAQNAISIQEAHIAVQRISITSMVLHALTYPPQLGNEAFLRAHRSRPSIVNITKKHTKTNTHNLPNQMPSGFVGSFNFEGKRSTIVIQIMNQNLKSNISIKMKYVALKNELEELNFSQVQEKIIGTTIKIEAYQNLVTHIILHSNRQQPQIELGNSH